MDYWTNLKNWNEIYISGEDFGISEKYVQIITKNKCKNSLQGCQVLLHMKGNVLYFSNLVVYLSINKEHWFCNEI